MVSSTVAFDKKSSSTPVEHSSVDQNDSGTISSMPFSSSVGSACNDTAGVLTHDSSSGASANDVSSALSFSEQKISLLFPKCKPRSEYHYVVNNGGSSSSSSACANGNNSKNNNNCPMDVGSMSLGSTHSLAAYVTRTSPPTVATQASNAVASKVYMDMSTFGNNNSGGSSTTTNHGTGEFEYNAEKELVVGKGLQMNTCGMNNNIGGGGNNNAGGNNNHYSSNHPAGPGGGGGGGGGGSGGGGTGGGGMGIKSDMYGSGSIKHSSNQSVTKNTSSSDGYSFYYSNQPPSLTCSPTENQSAISVAALGNSSTTGGLLLSDDDETSDRSTKKDSTGAAARWMERNYCHLSVSHYPSVSKSKGGGPGGSGGNGVSSIGVMQPPKRGIVAGTAYKPVNCYNMVLQSPLEDESDMEDKLKYFNYQHEMQTYNSTRKDKLAAFGGSVDMHCGAGSIGSEGEEIVVLSSNTKEHGNSLSVTQPKPDSLADELVGSGRKGVLHMGQKLEHVPHVGLSVASPSVENEQTLNSVDFGDKMIGHYPVKPIALEDSEEMVENKPSSGSNIIEYDGSPRRFGLNLCDESDCYLASSMKINLTSPSLLTLPRPGFPQRVLSTTAAATNSNSMNTGQSSTGNASCSPSLLDQVNSTLSKTLLLESKNARSQNETDGAHSYGSGDLSKGAGSRKDQDHHVYDLLPCDIKAGKPSPSDMGKSLEKIQLNAQTSEDDLTMGTSSFPPIANSSTFDYLYEFSETRKVLEEFFKCPSTEDVEKFSDYNDSADEDGESLDVHYDYPVDLERSKTIETTYIGNVNGSGKQDNITHSPKSPILSDGPTLEEDDDDTADVEDEEEEDEKENGLAKYNYKLKSKSRLTDYCGQRKKKSEAHLKGHTGLGLAVVEGTDRFCNSEFDRRDDDGVRLSLKSTLQSASDARDYAMYVQSSLLKTYPEQQQQQHDIHSGSQNQSSNQHSNNVNELRFNTYINGESRTSSYDAINDSNYDGHPIISNGSDKDPLHYSLNGDSGDGRKAFTRKYSKNFNYSPDTTDYDSNCGDYDSEISPQYGSDFGLISGNGATMCDDLNNGVISATSGAPTGTGESLNCLFANNANNYSRYYAAMPVLEDGLSSGHVSDSENNLNANTMTGLLPPDLVTGSVKQLTGNGNTGGNGGLMQTGGGNAYGLLGAQSPSAKQSISSSPIVSKEMKGAPGPNVQQPQQQQQNQSTNVEGYFVNNTFRMGNLKLNSSMLHNTSIFKNRDPELESLYTITSGNQSRKTFDKSNICASEFSESLGTAVGGAVSGGGTNSVSGGVSAGPSLSPIWIPRTRANEDFGSKPLANGGATLQTSVGGTGSNVLSNGLQSVSGASCKLSSSPSSMHTSLQACSKVSGTAAGSGDFAEETDVLIAQGAPSKTMTLVDEDEDPDTDLETDRLLGHQRLDDQGFYDESNSKLWSSERKTGAARLLTLGKVSPKQQNASQPTSTVGTAAGPVGGSGAGANGKPTSQGQLGGTVGVRGNQPNGTGNFLPTSGAAITSSGIAGTNSSIALPDLATAATTMPTSVAGNTVNGGVASTATNCHKSSKTSGNLINFNGPNEPQTQLTSPNPSPQHSLSEGNLLDKSNDSGSPSGSTKSKSLHNNDTKRKSKNKEVLIEGVLFRARYLGSTQLVCEGQPTKSTRMLQAEEAVSRIKSPDGEVQPSTEVDLFISTEKIMVLNTDLKEIMMDHALRTISYIADIGDLVVLMARRRFVPQDVDSTDSSGGAGNGSGSHTVRDVAGSGSTPSQKLASGPKGNRTPKMICHVFESEEAQFIAQSIGQAFQVAYMEFLKANGIEDHSFMKEMDYQEVLNSQEIFGDELEIFAKKELQKEVVVPKAKGEILGVVIVESGWGSMLPTVVIANLASSGAAARCGQLNIGDQIIAINGLSLVGLPLSTCQGYIKNTKNQTVVKFTVVPCAPVVEVKIKRPNTKYQLGFSVQNGVICSLLRGGIAERGGVRVGHRIIEINNQSVVAVPHEKIVNLLATSVGEILMKTMPTSMFRLLTGQENPIYI
uniref:Protein lin-10 n=1 Tax=Anopheles minimus TaxID=112268 RepID=A0A182W5I0_9DIPT